MIYLLKCISQNNWVKIYVIFIISAVDEGPFSAWQKKKPKYLSDNLELNKYKVYMLWVYVL